MAKKEDVLKAIALLHENHPRRTFDELNKDKMGYLAVIHFLRNVDRQVTSKEISDCLHVSSARMTVILKKLQKEEVITKEKSTEDARALIVTFTEKGKERAVLLHQKRYELVESIVDEFGIDEIENLFYKLTKIHNIMENHITDLEEEK